MNTDGIKDVDIKNKIKDFSFKLERYIDYGKKFDFYFYNPLEFSYITGILKAEKINYYVFSGGDNCERKTLSFDENENPIVVLRIDGITSNICHRDVLGSLLNAGLKRDDIGDIRVNEQFAEVAILKNRYKKLYNSLDRIKNVDVSLSLKNIGAFEEFKADTLKKTVTVQSLRLDSILSQMLKLSRNKAQILIRQGKIKLNYQVTNMVDAKIDDGSMISVTGIGRFVVDEVNGLSRKGRTYIVFHKMIWYDLFSDFNFKFSNGSNY